MFSQRIQTAVKSPLWLLSSLLLGTGLPMVAGVAKAQPVQSALQTVCERFASCIQLTLASDDPVQRVLLTTRALELWDKSMPQRDLVNVLALRGGSLLELVLLNPDSGLQAHLLENEQRFLKLAPEHWLPLSRLGRLYELQQKTALAQKHFDRATQANLPRAFAARAAFFQRQLKWQLALQDLNAAFAREQSLREQDRGLPQGELAALYAQRAEVHSALQHSLEARLDQQKACELGLKALCS